MKTRVKIITMLVLCVILILPTSTVSASGLMDGRVVFAGTFILESGESLEGDLVVIAGTATIEANATVEGDTVVMGGNLSVDGTVEGDVVVIGGAITLGGTALLQGNLTTVGASLQRADGAVVEGEIFNSMTSWVWEDDQTSAPVVPWVPAVPGMPQVPVVRIGFTPFYEVFRIVLWSIALGALAMLVMLFLVTQTERVSQAMVNQPIQAGGLGLLTVFLAPVAFLLLSITLVLFPVALLLLFLIALAITYGWIAIGYEIGQRFTKAIKHVWHPSLAAGFGTFLLTLIAGVIMLIPCIGLIAFTLVSALAIGGIIVSRVGTQAVTAPIEATAIVASEAGAGEATTAVAPPTPEKPTQKARSRKAKT